MTTSSTPLTDANMILVEGDTPLAPSGSDEWMNEMLAKHERYELTVTFGEAGEGDKLGISFASPVDGTLFYITGEDDEEAGLLFMVMECMSTWLGREIRAFAGGRVTGKGTYTVTIWA